MFEIREYQGPNGQTLRYGHITRPGRAQPAQRAMLFVPGLGGSVKGALKFLNQLNEMFDPIYAPDLRGFGINDHVPLPDDPRVHMEDLRHFAQMVELHEHKALTLSGISLGAAVSTWKAVHHPDWYDSLVLIAPAFKPSPVSFPLSYVIKNTARMFLGGKQMKLPYATASLTRNPAELGDPNCELPPLNLPTDYMVRVSLFNRRAFGHTKRIQIPTMIIVPGQDIICCPQTMRKGFERINAPKELRHYPDSYHDILAEPEAPEVAQDIMAWIRQVDASRND